MLVLQERVQLREEKSQREKNASVERKNECECFRGEKERHN